VESIAENVGLDPQETLKQIRSNRVQRLRAGQVLDIDVRRAESYGVPRADLSEVRAGPQTDRASAIAEFGEQIYRGTTFADVWARPDQFLDRGLVEQVPFLGSPIPEEGVPAQPGTPFEQPFQEPGIYGPQTPEWYTPEYAETIKANADFNNRTVSRLSHRESVALAARWTGLAVDYYMKTGDDKARPNTIPPEIFEQFPLSYQQFIRDYMGYIQDADGTWRRLDLPEEGYGMGGYEYPGYDYGGGGYGGYGGGGDYEYKPRGGTHAIRRGGGKTSPEVRQLYAGGISPAHWRI
jgi:hypothetical protein